MTDRSARVRSVEAKTVVNVVGGDDLEAAKTAIVETYAVIFDAEVKRAHRELSDSIDE